MYDEQRRALTPPIPSPQPPAPPLVTPAPPITPKSYAFLPHNLSPMSSLHTILGKKANRSSSLSQVVNYFESSPSMSEHSMSLLDSPLHRTEFTPKHHSSFYNPRKASDSDSDSEDDNGEDFLRDQSPEVAENDNRGLRSRTRGLKGYIGPKRWPDRLKGNNSSSSSSGLGTGGSNSTTSLTGQQETNRQGSPELYSSNVIRGSMSDIGSEDLPMTKLSVSRNESNDTRNLSPMPRNLQRIAATLAEESAPTESEMKREGMLYRYLRDYTPSSPMNSPLDPTPFEMDPEEDIIDSQSWWGTEQPNLYTPSNPLYRRDPSPNIDPMDTSNPPSRRPSVPPISTMETTDRRPSFTFPGLNDQMTISPTNTTGMMPPPPSVPQIVRMKRKATADYGLDAATAIKRRAISPGSSPLLSPIAIGGVRERRVLNLQDTHNGLEKMSLQD